jgi:hypothetical protein
VLPGTKDLVDGAADALQILWSGGHIPALNVRQLRS